jgi:hypothetical protein
MRLTRTQRLAARPRGRGRPPPGRPRWSPEPRPCLCGLLADQVGELLGDCQTPPAVGLRLGGVLVVQVFFVDIRVVYVEVGVFVAGVLGVEQVAGGDAVQQMFEQITGGAAWVQRRRLAGNAASPAACCSAG